MKKPSMEQVENEGYKQGRKDMKNDVLSVLIKEIKRIEEDIEDETITEEEGRGWIASVETAMEIIEEVKI